MGSPAHVPLRYEHARPAKLTQGLQTRRRSYVRRRIALEGMKEMGGDEDDRPSAEIGKFGPACAEEIRPE
jgi:hypothetical protein